MAVEQVTASIGDSPISFETGKLAKQANGSVLVRSGDTMVLVTAVGAQSPRPGADFFPLTVDVEERMYAAGKIPGGFIKRESRPSDRATLTARMTDRPIRPLLPEGVPQRDAGRRDGHVRRPGEPVRHPLHQRRVRRPDALRAAVRRPHRRRPHRADRGRVHHQPDPPGDCGVASSTSSWPAPPTRSRWSRRARRRSTRTRSSRPSRSPTRRSARLCAAQLELHEGGRQGEVGRRADRGRREAPRQDREEVRQGPGRGHRRAGQAGPPRQGRRAPPGRPGRDRRRRRRPGGDRRLRRARSTRSRRRSSAAASRSTSSAPTAARPTRSGRSPAR